MLPGTDDGGPRFDRRVFKVVFWGLALIEAVGIAIWDADRWHEQPVAYVLIVLLAPVLLLGHGNVFPAVAAAWLWRRIERRRGVR